MKQFECFWGDGYRHDDKKSTLAYYDLHFFNEDRGYSFEDCQKISLLDVGQICHFNECGEHWVRRIA
jgi:hypothetical protein